MSRKRCIKKTKEAWWWWCRWCVLLFRRNIHRLKQLESMSTHTHIFELASVLKTRVWRKRKKINV